MASKKVFIDIRVSDKQASRAVKKTTNAVDDLASSTERLARANNQNRAQSGLNNAILIETGRVASDASFGIQGVANNIGRLIELFQEFSRTGGKGGVAGAFKELGKSLMGVGGIIVGVQLLLSFLPKITKAFSNWLAQVTAVTKALRDATETYGSQIGALETYVSFVQDSNVSDEQRAIAIGRIKDEFKDLNLDIQDNTQFTQDQIDKINDYIETLQRQAESQALLSAIQEKYKENFLNSTESISENLFTWEGFLGLIGGGGLQGAFQGAAKAISNDSEEIQEDINLLLEKLKEIGLFSSNSENGLKATRLRRVRVFKEVLDDLTRLEEKYRKQTIDKDMLTEEQKIEMQKEFALRDLEIRQKDFEEKETIRLKNFVKQTNENRERALESIKGKKNEKELEIKIDKEYNEALKDAYKTFNKEIADSQKQAASVRIQIEKATNQKFEDLSDKRRERLIDNIDKIRNAERELSYEKDRIALEEKSATAGRIESLYIDREKIELTIQQTNLEKERLQGLIDSNNQAIESTKERLNSGELSIEERDKELLSLSNFQMNAVKLDAEYTRISAKNSNARKKITQAEANARVQAFEVVGDALNAFADLAGENSKAGKALSVAGTLVSTYSSAQKAYESQFTPIPTPDSPIRGAIAAAAAVASGLANVKAILSVNAEGESGLKSTVQAPAFNVVGTSQVNQLAETVSAQLGNQPPVRAFVVGAEVTDQQALDRKIEETAGLG